MTRYTSRSDTEETPLGRSHISRLTVGLVAVVTVAAVSLLLRSRKIEPGPSETQSTSYDVDDLYSAGL